MYRLERHQRIPRPMENVWDFFCDPQNLNAMTPAFLDFEIVRGGDEPMRQGQEIEYRIRILPGVRSRWLTEITLCIERDHFVDEQRVGPYKTWRHLHIFNPRENGVEMVDLVDYELPFRGIGSAVHSLFVNRRLKTIFDFRQRYLERRFGV